MGKRTKTKRPPRPMPLPGPTGIDATPERLRQAADDALLADGTIDKAGERKPTVRRFADTPLDRMFRAKRLTYAQWFAGDWLRRQHAAAHLPARTTAAYAAQAGGGGSCVGTKLLGSERNYAARKLYRDGRDKVQAQMLRLVEDVVVHEVMPVFRNGQQGQRYAAQVGAALEPLATWLNAPVGA